MTTEIIHKKEVAENENIVELVAFELLTETYAIDIKYVEEIQRPQHITDVPNAEEYILGVINLRGQIIPVIDLKLRFKMGETEISNASRIIVVRVSGMVVSLQVDSVTEVLRLRQDLIEAASPVMATTIEDEYIKGIGKRNGKMIIILDVEKMIMHKIDTVNLISDGYAGLLDF